MKRSEESILGLYEDQHLEDVDEEMLERLFWEFDSETNGRGDERLAFKGKMRFFARFCGGNRDIQRFAVLAELFVEHAEAADGAFLTTIDDVRGAMDWIIEQRNEQN